MLYCQCGIRTALISHRGGDAFMGDHDDATTAREGAETARIQTPGTSSDPTTALPRAQSGSSVSPDDVQRLMAESSNRFAAGTTYGGQAEQESAPPVQPPPRPAPPRIAAPPTIAAPPPPTPAPAPPPTLTPPPATPPPPPTFSGVAIDNRATTSGAATDLDFLPTLTLVLALIFPPMALPVGYVTRAHFGSAPSRQRALTQKALILAYVSLGLFGVLVLVSLIVAVVS